VIVARRAAALAVALVLAGCGSNTTPAPTATPSAAPAATAASAPSQAAAPANVTGSGSVIAPAAFVPVLPWDVAKTAAHEILCAYNSEGIVGGVPATSSYCGHHIGGPDGTVDKGYTQDEDALDFDLQPGDAVRAVAPGYVRWAGSYPNTKSWSCFGVSIAVDTPLADGTVVTTFYAHLGSLVAAAGQVVKAGDTIAKSGSSGGGSFTAVCPAAYSPHLHVGIYTNANYIQADGKPVNAVALLASTTATTVPTVVSPPYGGDARLPEGWADCSRSSKLVPPPAGETSACTGLHAGDTLTYTGPGGAPVTPPTVLSGTWVAPADGAKLTTSILTLSAKPSVTTPTVTVTKVAFSVTWGSTTKAACSAMKAGSGGVWSCNADLWKLGAPLGKLTLSFDATDSAGDVAKAPAGTRTVTFAAPPPKPANPSWAELPQTPLGDPVTKVIIAYRARWSEPNGAATEFTVYGVKGCLLASTSKDGAPCVKLGMVIPERSLVLLGKAPGDARSLIVKWTVLEGAGPLEYQSFLIRATNAAGSSKYTILDAGEVCSQCAW
jgi:murein DD-endopeptidase MepM/ murein hydrolase activator NlpD